MRVLILVLAFSILASSAMAQKTIVLAKAAYFAKKDRPQKALIYLQDFGSVRVMPQEEQILIIYAFVNSKYEPLSLKGVEILGGLTEIGLEARSFLRISSKFRIRSNVAKTLVAQVLEKFPDVEYASHLAPQVADPVLESVRLAHLNDIDESLLALDEKLAEGEVKRFSALGELAVLSGALNAYVRVHAGEPTGPFEGQVAQICAEIEDVAGGSNGLVR